MDNNKGKILTSCSDSPPLVTIAIPVYNAEKFVGSTLRSILDQDYPNIHINIFDNCSTDNTLKEVAKFLDTRIEVFSNDINLGAEGNWNRCLNENVKGKYFKLVCADDIIYPPCISEQVGVLESDEYEDIGFCFCRRDIINSNGEHVVNRKILPQEGVYLGVDLLRKVVTLGGNPIGEPVVGLIRSDLMNEIGLYDITIPYVIDVDYWARMLTLTDTYYIDKPLSAFRVSKESWTSQTGYKQVFQYVDFMNKLISKHSVMFSKWDRTKGKMRVLKNFIGRMVVMKILA